MMRTIVFGSSGLLGSALVKTSKYETLKVTTKDVDLRNQEQVENFLSRHQEYNDIWINSAAKVGGVKANTDFIADFYKDNIDMQNNIVDQAKKKSIRKLVSILSTCVYPDFDHVTYPLTEEQLHNGPPHFSNFGYAYAKRMIDVASRSYRQQWGCNFITVIPNNLYGINDNYDLNNGHVIPALIRKFFEAKKNNTDVIIWGSGNPLREFTFAEDAAKIIWWLSENYNDETPVNIGCTNEVSIGDLSILISKIMNFKGNIKFDKTKPDGQYRKPTSNQKLKNLGHLPEYITLEEGLAKTIDDFIEKYPKIKGI